MSSYGELRREAYEANLELPRHGLVTFTFGNVSAFDRARGVLAIKPSGVSYQRLTAQDMVVVDLDNHVVEGSLRPSSDTKTHIVLYRHFDTIGGVAHTHSCHAVSWAQAMRPIPIMGTTHADHLACDIPCTEVMDDHAVKGDYEEETGRQIVKRFADLSFREIEMVLVACHGPFTWGGNAMKAVYSSVMCEELARMAMMTLGINPSTPRLKQSLIDKHWQRKHGENAYYGQPEGH